MSIFDSSFQTNSKNKKELDKQCEIVKIENELKKEEENLWLPDVGDIEAYYHDRAVAIWENNNKRNKKGYISEWEMADHNWMRKDWKAASRRNRWK